MSKQSKRRRKKLATKSALPGVVQPTRQFTTPIQTKSLDPTPSTPSESVKQIAFLAAYALCGGVVQAAKAAGCDRSAHNYWLAHDPAYRDRFADAQATANDRLEAEARRRAVVGMERMKFYQGKPIIDPRTGTPYIEHEYSDRMLEILLRAHMPDKYLERQKIENVIIDGGDTIPDRVQQVLADPARIEAELKADEQHLK